MSDQQWLVLRTQEIIANSEGISVNKAIAMALVERYDDIHKLAEAMASSMTSVAKAIKKSTYELPDQATLFDIPATIFVDDEAGGFFVGRDRAELGMVRQWAREGERHHAVQRYRFKRMNNHLNTIESLDDSMLWSEARLQIEVKGDSDGQE